jgi:hypothetical protein
MGCTRVTPEQRAIIEREANANGLDPDFVEAIAIVEAGSETYVSSGGGGSPVPGVNWDPGKNKDGSIRPRWAHGMMQVGIDEAYAAGYPNPAPDEKTQTGAKYSAALASDENSIKYGTAYLAKNAKDKKNQCALNDFACIASAYNAGTARGRYGGWRAAPYVDKVLGVLAKCIKGKPLSDFIGPLSPPPNGGGGGGGGTPPVYGPFQCTAFNPETDRIIPYPMPSNPYFAYFMINVLGVDISGQTEDGGGGAKLLTPQRPQYVTYFEFSEKFGGMTEAHVRLFDPNWDVVEGKILDPLRNTTEDWVPEEFANSSISFGYARPNPEQGSPFGEGAPEQLWSATHLMRLMTYHPDFVGYGVEMEMYFIGNTALDNLVAKSRVYNNERIASGDPDDPGIVESMCQEPDKQWEMCTARTVPLTENGAGLESNAPAPRQLVQDNISDEAFFTRMTDMCAMEDMYGPDGQPNSGFYAWTYDTATRTIHYHPPIAVFWQTPQAREYTYARQQYGAVVSFKPDVMGAALAQLGGMRTIIQLFDAGRKRAGEAILDQRSAPNSPVTGQRVSDGTIPALDTGDAANDRVDAKRYFFSAQPNMSLGWVEGLQMWQAARFFTLRAELTVIGDPLIRPGWKVGIKVITYRMDEDGRVIPRIHYTSGVWMVMEIRHVISGGQYLTFLSLLRNDAFNGGQPVEQGQQSAQQGVTESSSSAFLDSVGNNAVTL